MNFKNLVKAMTLIESDRKISQEVVIEALEEALAKAYRKHVDIPDILVRVDINKKSDKIRVYQQYLVVEELEDEELEINLKDAKIDNPDIKLGDLVEKEVSIDNLGRSAVSLAKNVIKQKIREAEKAAIYNEYIDLLDDMVLGVVASVEEKFVLVDLGKTLALMPKAAQIPGETYIEGKHIKVVITECNKDGKGSQILVSRADEKLVKRLFENEVPEIFQGIIEIKAIAREAGERTKMAVYSKDPDIDAIGSCIGPRGSRVLQIIEELKGEKIDIFEWSSNVSDLVKNALSPADVTAVLPTEDEKSLLVVVPEDQLSLAIGRRGKNARLAVRLTNMKIDIKTREELESQGFDLDKKMFDYEVEQEKIKREAAAKEISRAQEEVESIVEDNTEIIENEVEDTTQSIDTLDDNGLNEQEEIVNDVKEEISNSETPETTIKEEIKVTKKKVKKEVKDRTEYVSVFEKLADNSKPRVVEKKDDRRKKRKDKDDSDDRKLRSIDLKKDKDYEIKPVYSEEELEEIALNEELESRGSYDDIDYDEFEDYYDDNEL
ncbi:MAG: transcription termination factor NusA [Anaerorhabdus sp.]